MKPIFFTPKTIDEILANNETSEDSLIAKGQGAKLSGRKYDIVISEDPNAKRWQKNMSKTNGLLFNVLVNGASGYPIYIAGKTGFFDRNDNFAFCFDRQEIDRDLQQFDNAPQGDIDYLLDWMTQNDISYETEGYIACYRVSTKQELINLLKSCAIINDIIEVDRRGKILQTY